MLRKFEKFIQFSALFLIMRFLPIDYSEIYELPKIIIYIFYILHCICSIACFSLAVYYLYKMVVKKIKDIIEDYPFKNLL